MGGDPPESATSTGAAQPRPGEAGKIRLSWRIWVAVLALCFLCHLLPLLRLVDEDARGFLWGDALYYALAAESLAERGTLDLVPQLSPEELRVALDEHQLARGAAGELVIKHGSILPFLGVPFVALLGLRGLLLLNVLFTVGVVVAMAPLLRRYVGTAAALATAYLLGTATLLSPYAYNFSADVAGTCVLVAGVVALLGGAPFAAGVLLGAAVALKLSLLPVVLVLGAGGVGLALVHGGRSGDGIAVLLRLTLGGLCGVAPLLAMNHALFGSVWVTGYQRIALADGGTLTHLSDFNQPLASGLVAVLFDGTHGLISTNPILLLGALGLAPLLRLRSRSPRLEVALLLAAAAAQVVVVSTYDFWDQSHVSNRFLLVVVPLVAPLVALAVNALGQAAGLDAEPGA